MRLTVRTNLAMRVLMHAAVAGPGTLHAGDVALACNASAHHVALVVSRLAEAGLLLTHRGRGGGIELARRPEAITVGEVVRLFEADVPFTECMDLHSNTCPLPDACRLKGVIMRAVGAFYAELDGVTVGDLVAGNEALAAILMNETHAGGMPCRVRLGA